MNATGELGTVQFEWHMRLMSADRPVRFKRDSTCRATIDHIHIALLFQKLHGLPRART